MFKLSSLIPSWSQSIGFVSINAARYLSTAQPVLPNNFITNDALSYTSLRRLFYIHRDERGKCAIRSQWHQAFTEKTSEGQEVLFRDITGCLSSKSHLTDFEEMRDDPKSSANVRFHIREYENSPDVLAERVLNGRMDCAIYKNKPVRVVRQEWDGKMWLNNDGGSHRSAAVWHLDRMQGRERHLPANIKTYGLSDEFREQCQTHSIWLFKTQERAWLLDKLPEMKEGGLSLSLANNNPIYSSEDFCLIVKKSDPQYSAIAATMGISFDLSHWVNEAYKASAPAAPTPDASLDRQP